MGNTLNNGLWTFCEAGHVRKRDHFFMIAMVVAGTISIIGLAEWWFRANHVGNVYLFVVLSLFFWYSMVRITLVWVNYAGMKKPPQVPIPPDNLQVAIFTTCAPGEPLSMFRKTFEALNRVQYPHTTYLLDGSGDPAFRALAEEFGIRWLNMEGVQGAKAGKINRALSQTDEEFILVLDPDHIVFPNFLDQTLGFFQDEKVGFVQVSQGYYNQYRSFTAAGAAEQTYLFYGPTQMGLHGYGAAVAIGANCTFRRKALESIGGHGKGLAEDLLTSLRIHAAGWKSVYNPVIVSRGLVPEDLGSFFKQQLKWARGVFELLFTEIPGLFRKLTFWQKLSYATIGTYYFIGLTTFLFILIPFIFFFTGIIPGKMRFSDFIIQGSFVALISTSFYFYVQRFLCHRPSERGFHWRGMVLKYSSWPVYLFGFLLSLIRAEIPYIPTAKKAIKGPLTPFAKPLIGYCILFILTVTGLYIQRRFFTPESELLMTSAKVWGMVGFSFLAFIQSLGGILAAIEARQLPEDDPWDHIQVDQIRCPEPTRVQGTPDDVSLTNSSRKPANFPKSRHTPKF